MCDANKVMNSEKFIDLNAHVKKEKQSLKLMT